MPPQKRFSAQDTPQNERNHPKTTVYNHYDQSYPLTQTPDQTSNNAIFSVFKHTNHVIWVTDHTSQETHSSLRPFWPVIPVFEEIRLKGQNKGNTIYFNTYE